MLTGISGSKQVRNASITWASIMVVLMLSIELFNPQLQFGAAGKTALIPWRIPNQFNIGLGDLWQSEQFSFDVFLYEISHAAALSSQGEIDHCFVAAFRQRIDTAMIDQAKVDDIDRDLRIETSA